MRLTKMLANMSGGAKVITIIIFLLMGLIIYISFPKKVVDGLLTESDAMVIAQESCIHNDGYLDTGYYNKSTKTWWFDAYLDTTAIGCNPACIVSEDTRTAQLNPRCTDLSQ